MNNWWPIVLPPDTPIIISLIIGLLTLGALLYVASKQIIEVLMPVDWLTRLRWLILLLLIMAIFGVVPVIYYNILRLQDMDSQLVRNIANVTGNISRASTAFLLVMVYNYRRKE